MAIGAGVALVRSVVRGGDRVSKEIYLKTGETAIVDDDLYDELSQYNWYLTGSGSGYASGYKRGIKQKKGQQKQILMHRLITNAPTGMQVSHLNGNRLDNRRCNLNVCSISQNAVNRSVFRKNKTGFKGVYRAKDGRYIAQIRLGIFESAEDAAAVYKKTHMFLHGVHSNFNERE